MTNTTHFYEKFVPEHYDLLIDVNREHKQISGISTITGDAKDKRVYVHQKYMTIASVKADGADVPYTFNDKDEAITIDLPQTGKTTLAIAYKAPLTDTMMGIYPSYYELDGEKKQLIGTQFETTAARQAFPSIDEPEAKATFDLALKFDEHDGETVIANMPENHVKDGVHYFDTTVKMSTYLVAFAFGDMQSKMTTTKSGVKVGVFSTKAHAPKELDFALDIAKRSIEFYEKFYETPYPLPHSWQLALPDFSAGAMENWGLVTYREAYLTLDPDNTSLEMKKLVATVIAHELAHQWFGDLVTMKWWDDLWLNESFANMMEYVAIDAIEPDWHIWEMFQTSEAPSALHRDATDGVQSVHVQVEDPAEIDALFDSAIVYAKGSRMLVMVRALLGDDDFRAGLKAYFEAHKYNNAKGDDLWSALGAASHLDVGAIMHSWLEQPGYPVVSASVDNGKLKISQQQFFIGEGKEVGRQWQIPLASNYSAAPQIFKDKEFVLGDYKQMRAASGEPFRLNVGNNSHFIVKYDETLLADILKDADKLDNISQLQLLQDLGLLAQGGQASYAELVKLLPRFADSKSGVVNAALYSAFGSLRKFTTPDSAEELQMKKFAAMLSGSQLERLGWMPKAGESSDDQQTRQDVMGAAIYSGSQEAVQSAHEIFGRFEGRLNELPADIRPYILLSEVRNFGNADLIKELLAQYRTTSDASYKGHLRTAITATEDPEQIKLIVKLFEDADTVKPQDLRAWYRGVLTNKVGQQYAWDWIKSQWQWLSDTVGGDMEFPTYIQVTANAFHTPERLAEFKAFFEPKLDTPGLGREIKMDTSVVAAKVDLIAAEKDVVNATVAEVLD
ncbi:M1 family metallopeptidase [Lacticaseibacillus pabuli]|uniref:Aminopeptidase n=1 Tax=Lacticaseibacillus pabuli TaxID=3025672 RepID=A0ABY7WT10_9LACO|nr:M1 family metallopeptidase [Lacticaseibacillus sp. KACC 23028]WDF83308.1 M1 family metallopeptidase [Lacticaseibacillus sp. KACC 23028]